MSQHQEFDHEHDSDPQEPVDTGAAFGPDPGDQDDSREQPDGKGTASDSAGAPGSDPDPADSVSSAVTGMPATDERTGRTRTDEVLDLIAGVEDQLERMRNAQATRVSEIESIEERRQSLETREAEVAEIGRQLEQRQGELESRRCELDEFEVRLEESRTTMDSATDEIARRERELDERTQRFVLAENELNERRSAFEKRLADLERERDVLASDRNAFAADRAAMLAELAALRGRTEELESLRSNHHRERDALAGRIEELTSTLDSMSDRAAVAEEHAAQLDQQALDLSANLEQAADAIEVRDAQIAERDMRISERQAEFEELQGNLELATDKLQSLAAALAEQAPRIEEEAAAAALCRQQEGRLAILSEELAAARAEITRLERTDDPEDLLSSTREELHRVRLELDEMIPLDEHRRVVASLEAGIARTGHGGTDSVGSVLEAELEQARAELESLTDHVEHCEETIRNAEEKVLSLRDENERLQRLADEAGASSGDGSADCDDRMRDQAKRISEFAIHLQRRRERLRSVRRALARRQGSSGTTDAITPGLVEIERRNKVAEEDLLRRKHELVDVESRMIRRWASHGAFGMLVKATFLVVILAAASWFGVLWFAPGDFSASALVKAQPVTGGAMDPERAEAWNEWHRNIVGDELFSKAVAARLDSSVAGFDGGQEAVDAIIADDLIVTGIEPGMLGFRLSGTDRGDTLRVLEALVATLSAESQRQLPRRGDGGRMNVMTSHGRVVTLDPAPVTTEQLQQAGMVFGGSLGLVGLLGAAVYARLSRTRRIFDENLGLDEDGLI